MAMQTTMWIRHATKSDVETLLAFSEALAMETESRQLDTATLREGIRAFLSAPQYGHILVAETAEEGLPRIVGQLMITYEWSDWRNGVFWWVQSVYIDPAWRRQGVYRSLHEHVEAQAINQSNVCGIRLYVEQHNRQAQTVYQRVGLSPAGYIVYEKDFVLHRHTSISEPLEG